MSKVILFVVNVDWFFVSHRLPLAKEALSRGYQVHVACSLTDKKEFLEGFGMTVHQLGLSRSGANIVGEFFAFWEIYKLLDAINPDIAHFITIKPVLYGGAISRFLPIRKRVFSISGLGFLFTRRGLRSSVIRSLIKFIYKFSLAGLNSHVIVQNPDDEELVCNLVKVPVSLIRGSGVCLAEYPYIAEPSEKVKVTMACRLLKDKGVFEYVEAAEILKKNHPNIEFALYGDIDLHNPASLNAEDCTTISREGNVSLCGFSCDIAQVFVNSNIIVLPSYREGLPKVLVEAAACGRAVVTTDVPGCRDAIIPNVSGLLCAVSDAHSLAQAIEQLVYDRTKRISMGKCGRELAENEFSIEHVVNIHFDIYERHCN